MGAIAGNTLISSFYSIEPFMPAALAFSAKKIVLLVDAEPDAKLRENLETIKKTFGSAVFVKTINVKQYDLLDVAKKTVEVLEREHGEGNAVYLNVTGGRRTVMLGALMACYVRPELVKKIVYSAQETNEFVELPKLSMTLSKTKREILEDLAKKRQPIPVIAEKLEKTRGMVYAHLRELKDVGFVDEDFNLTTAGRIALI